MATAVLQASNHNDNDLATPSSPVLLSQLLSELALIQQELWNYSYNRESKEYYPNIQSAKNKNFLECLSIAKQLIQLNQPIKCLEAVLIAIYRTQFNQFFIKNCSSLHRYAVRFCTSANGHRYWHIVLIIQYNNKYGAVALSRQANLQNKEMKFESFEHIIGDYIENYRQLGHQLELLTISAPIPYFNCNDMMHDNQAEHSETLQRLKAAQKDAGNYHWKWHWLHLDLLQLSAQQFKSILGWFAAANECIWNEFVLRCLDLTTSKLIIQLNKKRLLHKLITVQARDRTLRCVLSRGEKSKSNLTSPNNSLSRELNAV
jgi:hypothetical protein